MTRAIERRARRVHRQRSTSSLYPRLAHRYAATPREAQAAAQGKARERYEAFVEALGRRLAKGQSFSKEVSADIANLRTGQTKRQFQLMFGLSTKASALPKDSVSIEKLIREEIDRDSKYFEFAKQQIEADRKFYTHLYTYAGGFLVFMVAAAGFFQFSSVNQMRSDMRAAVEAALADVRVEVKNRIDREFRSENIANLVEKVARERTENELSEIIRSETSARVASGLKAQESEIRGLVEGRTNKLVDELEPTIKKSFLSKQMNELRLH